MAPRSWTLSAVKLRPSRTKSAFVRVPYAAQTPHASIGQMPQSERDPRLGWHGARSAESAGE